MKKVSLAILISLGAVTGAAYAQESGVTMSTDPARAADVEQRAQELQNRPQTMESAPAPMKHHKSSPHHKKGMKSDEFVSGRQTRRQPALSGARGECPCSLAAKVKSRSRHRRFRLFYCPMHRPARDARYAKVAHRPAPCRNLTVRTLVRRTA